MKTKTLKADIAKKNPDELVEFIRSERETLRAGRFQRAGAGVSVSQRTAKKNIARAHTALRKAKAN